MNSAGTFIGFLAMACAAIAPAHAANDGYIDGIYQCNIVLEGKTTNAYMSLNGKKDGRTVYLVAADTASRDGYSGYGLGLISGNKFTGNTSFNKRFDFTIGFSETEADSYGYAIVLLKGVVGVVGSAGKPVNARVDCSSIW